MNTKPPEIMGYRMEEEMPLHQLACKRIRLGRDLKIIITAEDSETGVGKTTAAGWLALVWTHLFAGHDWYVDPDNYGEGMGTVNPKEYFRIIGKIPGKYNPGTVVIVDDAEELDARRSMQNLNVEFSQRWMLMRLKQVITIITLPSPSSMDKRLEELADVWINIHARGQGTVHDIRVQSYGSRDVMTKKAGEFRFPNVSSHEELERLRNLKEIKMERWDKEDEEEQDQQLPKEVQAEIAQEYRNAGKTLRWISENVESVEYSRNWISENTNPADDKTGNKPTEGAKA